jgi:dTDP-4-dehydrorhamnose 3,5-epimerase-like enzyme|tara:strand:+ start:1022 stop:1303 length:282 start_codon:yes stop_codon:yes gene_type:complete
MNSGALRGGHYHDKESVHLVLQGKIRFKLVDPSTIEKIEVMAKPMDIIRIPKGIAHLLEAIEESMFVEPWDKDKISFDYEPQRSLVKKILESE